MTGIKIKNPGLLYVESVLKRSHGAGKKSSSEICSIFLLLILN